MSFDQKTLSLYPNEPGVYLMKDRDGTILYIGKAKNLRNRIKQYFVQGRDSREMVPYLTAQVETIDTIIALTEKDALILENTLIKRHKPKYNILLKDDKSFISLILTKHKWPRLSLVRYKGNQRPEGTYFGPYTNALAARQTYDLLLKLFPLRQCSDSEVANRLRPCLLYDIKRCIAPCVNLCTEEEYQRHVDSITKLLRGKNKQVFDELEEQMLHAAENLDFERAEEFKRLIGQIKHVSEVKHIDNPEAKDADALGIYREANVVVIALLMFRNGKVIGSEHFSFHFIAADISEILTSFILQRFQDLSSYPREILVSHPIEKVELLQEIVSEIASHKVSIASPQKGRKKDLTDMALKNAKALFIREQDKRSIKEKMLLDLAETLQLRAFPTRIECLDTSNISGTDPVASLVSYTHGELDKPRLRLFKVREKSDDYSAMKEVLTRHLLKEKKKGEFCNLFIVDGGKGQLGVAMDVFEELGILSIDLIALTKEEARHDKGLTQERVFLPNRKDPVIIDRASPLLFFLQRIRDEAHKRAIEYHRKRRSKRTISSQLDEIPGIGPTKKKRLLQSFGSVKRIKEASKEELSTIEGLTKKDIEKLLSL